MVEMIKGYEGSLFDNGLVRRFVDIFPNFNTFKSEYESNGISKTITTESLQNLYYILIGRYGENQYAGTSEYIFKYSLFSLIYMYGPAWEARLELQKKIRNLTDTELMSGDVRVTNTARNPSTGNTQNKPFTPLDYIDGQNAEMTTRAKLSAYSLKYSQIVTDVTEEFVSKFKTLFRKVICNPPLYYITEE